MTPISPKELLEVAKSVQRPIGDAWFELQAKANGYANFQELQREVKEGK